MNKLVKKADILVVAYDCTDRSTFEHVPDTIMSLSKYMEKNLEGRSILISTKCEDDQKRK